MEDQRVPWHINKALLNLIGSTNKNVYEFFGHEPVILCPLCWSWYDFLIPLLVWSAWGYFFAGVFMAMMEIARPGQTRWSKWGPRLLLVFWMIDVSMVVLALPLSQEPSPKVVSVYRYHRIKIFRELNKFPSGHSLSRSDPVVSKARFGDPSGCHVLPQVTLVSFLGPIT